MMSPPNDGIPLSAVIMDEPEADVEICVVTSVPNMKLKAPETGTDLVTTTELELDKKTLCPAAGLSDKEVNMSVG
jgi:hypothetical protein